MKKYVYIFILFLFIANSAKAIDVSWLLRPSHTVRDGIWIYTDNNISTPVTGTFTITRKLLGSHANGDPYFETVNLVLNVVTYKLDGTRLVHYTRTITSQDFPQNKPSVVINDVNFYTKPLDLSIEGSGPYNGVYYNGQGVSLEYSIDGGVNFDYTNSKIYIPVTPNGYYASVPVNEGSFYNVVQNGKVYIRIGNKLHHICCPPVLSGLFNFSMDLVVNIGEKKLQEFQTGPTFELSTSIIHFNGGLYLKQGNVIRGFATPNAFNKHHFKFVYTDVNNINGLTIGESIY